MCASARTLKRGMANTCRSEVSLWESVLPLRHVCPRDPTQVARLGSRHHCTISLTHKQLLKEERIYFASRIQGALAVFICLRTLGQKIIAGAVYGRRRDVYSLEAKKWREEPDIRSDQDKK